MSGDSHHDDESSESLLDELGALMSAVELRCPACGVVPQVVRAAGVRHVLAVDHEPGCPAFVDLDDTPAAEYVAMPVPGEAGPYDRK